MIQYKQYNPPGFPELNEVAVEMYGSSSFWSALKHGDINCFLHVKEYLLCVKIVSSNYSPHV